MKWILTVKKIKFALLQSHAYSNSFALTEESSTEKGKLYKPAMKFQTNVVEHKPKEDLTSKKPVSETYKLLIF